MRVRVYFKNIKAEANIECFIQMRLEAVYNLLSSDYEIHVHLNFEQNFKTLIILENNHHRFAFSSEADTLSESCSNAIHLTSHFLREQQKINKKKFNQLFEIFE